MTAKEAIEVFEKFDENYEIPEDLERMIKVFLVTAYQWHKAKEIVDSWFNNN